MTKYKVKWSRRLVIDTCRRVLNEWEKENEAILIEESSYSGLNM